MKYSEPGQRSALERSYAKRGKKLPKPVLCDLLEDAWITFCILHKGRSAGFTINPISDYAIIMYLKELGRSGEDLISMHYMVRAMDGHFMQWHFDEQMRKRTEEVPDEKDVRNG